MTEIDAAVRARLAAEICPGDPLDEWIAYEVHVLRRAGVETYEACQGGDGHAYSQPTVRFHGTPAAGWHALGVAQDHGLLVSELRRAWTVYRGEPTGPHWELTFSGAYGNAPRWDWKRGVWTW